MLPNPKAPRNRERLSHPVIPRLAGLAAALTTVTVLAVTVCPRNANPWPADLAVLTLYGVTVFLGVAQAGRNLVQKRTTPTSTP